MALEVNPDLLLGFAAILLAGVVIYMFVRATGGFQQSTQDKRPREIQPEYKSSSRSRAPIQDYSSITERNQVEQARSTIRTQTLKQEIISMVMKRLFEAEDEGEISREEREQLAKDYENEMMEIEEELNKAELIVSLNELEAIRTNIIKQFETTLSDTQQKIDVIINELNIELPKPEEPEPIPEPRPRRRRPSRPRPEEIPMEEEEEDEEEERSRRRESVEDRLDKLKKDVLKELEELERLELEA